METSELVSKAEAKYGLAAAKLKEDRQALKRAKRHLKDCEEARTCLQSIAEKVQQQAHRQICGLVSKCLKAVFADEAYAFKIVFSKKRGKTEAKFVFSRGREDFDEPVGEIGLGMVEVANFALTISEIILTGKRRLWVADEPFRQVHGDENRERLAKLLPALADELGFQFVISTGLDWLQVGNVVKIQK